MTLQYCSHGHDSNSHPNCFRYKHWYDKQEDIKIGYLDIEASDLRANVAWMLSWAIKERDGKTAMDYVKLEEISPKRGVINMGFDRRITASLVAEMKKYDLLVGYYSTGFDIPFIRSRAMKHGIFFPRYGDINHVDVYYSVKSKMLLSRNSLKIATEFLEITGKTTLDFSYWRLALMGDQRAMKELLKHNEEDVKILEGLHKQIEPFMKYTKRSI